jgi:hypothetical protein
VVWSAGATGGFDSVIRTLHLGGYVLEPGRHCGDILANMLDHVVVSRPRYIRNDVSVAYNE